MRGFREAFSVGFLVDFLCVGRWFERSFYGGCGGLKWEAE